MHVLMLVSEAPPIKSGIARVAGQLTEGLRERGIQLDVLSANEIGRWTFKEFRLSSLVLHWPEIQRRLADYEILHVHGTVPTFSDVGLVLGRLGRRHARPQTGIVYTHHSDIDIRGLELPVSLYNAVHYRLLHLADHVVASTPSYAMRLESIGRPGRITPVGFGVDAARFQTQAAKPDRFQVLFVGQLRPYKGIDVLLQAWEQIDNADLHIVGDGHERRALETMAARRGLHSVHFHGAVTERELSDCYARAHVLVLPSTSRAEAFGLVLLEGMAAGCVPVASDLPGVRDVVGTSGYTFPVGDADALAARLLRLRDDRAGRETLAVRAAARAVAYAWDYTVEAYQGIYQQVYLGRLLETLAAGAGPTRQALDDWLQHVTYVAGADRASLMVLAPGGRELEIVASVGMDPTVAATARVRIGQRLSGFAAQTGRPLLVRPGVTPVVARLYARDPGLQSSLVLPIYHGGRPAGVLNLARTSARTPFTYADQQWLQRLAVQTAPIFGQYYPQPAPLPRPAPASERRIFAARSDSERLRDTRGLLQRPPA